MSGYALVGALAGSGMVAGIWLSVAGWMGYPRGQIIPKRLRRSEPRDRAVMRRAAVAVVVGLAVLAITGWPVVGLAAGFAAVGLPQIMSGSGAARSIAKLEALEQWTRRLTDLLLAGRGLEQAIEYSATRNLPAPITEPVTRLAWRMNTARMSAEKALRLLADELDDPVSDRIAAALILAARRRGAGAAAVLGGLAELVARDVTDRRQVEAARAEHRTTVRWIVAILLLLTTAAVLQRTYVQPFGTAAGQLVLLVVVACYAGTFWWLHRLGMPEKGRRFLSRSSGQEAGQ